MHLQMNHGGTNVHVQWFSTGEMEKTIMMSLCDIMRVSHAEKGKEL